ncbi:MAG: BC1881 family protein [Anaeromusa sp.]|uniref:BC1881 family protein n=1 Tax=Anaeromusa sp. TaxID=1872520 RepID=UPI002B1FA16C|nr:BC1881 family protein [Anaeromusa sp.]MEA4834994.1 BC1881 family protein [Anaeromusa sp.]
MNFLQEISTKDLVAELKKRAGVDHIRVEPHERYAFDANNMHQESTGPVVVLIVSD